MKKIFLAFFLINFLFAFHANAQCTSGNCIDGKGTFVYPSGAKYVGDFANGEIHGIGVCYYTNGSKYSGQWNHRYPEGMGTKTYKSGAKRTGKWLKGQPVDEDGNIVEFVTRGNEEGDDGTDIQSGCLDGDCENGKGVFAYADGSKYEGQFTNGNLEGWGTWFYPDGDKYVGTFKNNYSHGKGTIYHEDGNKTTGEWLEGEYIGDGRVENGRVGCISGDCVDGKGTYVYKGAKAKYVGTFKNGVANGRGVCYYANGEKYEGKWANGGFNGEGTLFLLDGTNVSGYWKDGTYKGKTKKEEIAETVAAREEIIVETPQEIVTDLVAKEVKSIKVWAVVVGVSSYSHMPALKYTDDDAYRMYAFLKSPEGGALKDDQIRILIDEDATNSRIRKEMEYVFSQAGPNDLIMLYFSGHGLKGSFLPIDFDGFNNKLFHEDINEIFSKSQAKYKLCIADACHSGSLLAMRGTVENVLNKYYTSLAQADAGTALIMSSKSEETSLESSGLRQGVFSHFLIRGLKGEADVDDNKVVSILELYNFINDNVRSYTGLRQSPVLKGDYDDKMTVSVIR